MDTKKILEIMKNKELKDIYYNDRPVWIQELNNNMARVGFIDNNEEKEVYADDLYESELFDSNQNNKS